MNKIFFMILCFFLLSSSIRSLQELRGSMKFGNDHFSAGYRLLPGSCGCENGCLAIYEGLSSDGYSLWSYNYFGDDKFCVEHNVTVIFPLENNIGHLLEFNFSYGLHNKDWTVNQEIIHLLIEKIYL